MALSLLLLFDLGEPVPTYRLNLKLRSSSLVVTENHRALTVRAGFQLQHHGHISLGIKAFFGALLGDPLCQGSPGCLCPTPEPYRHSKQGMEPAWGCSTEHRPCEFDSSSEKKVISVQMYIVYS